MMLLKGKSNGVRNLVKDRYTNYTTVFKTHAQQLKCLVTYIYISTASFLNEPLHLRCCSKLP